MMGRLGLDASLPCLLPGASAYAPTPQQGSFGVVGLLTWRLASSTISVPRDPGGSYVFFSVPAWEVTQCYMCHTLAIEGVTGPFRFNGKGHRPQNS